MSGEHEALERELRATIHALQRETRDLRKQLEEARDAIAALLEPDASRVVYGRSGTIIMRPGWKDKPTP